VLLVELDSNPNVEPHNNVHVDLMILIINRYFFIS